MTIISTPQEPKKRYRKADEAKLQSECFVWLWNEHPETRGLFFAVINENERSGYETQKMQEISGSRRKMRGVIAGVSDSIGLIPRGRFHGVCAEAKTKIGVQSAAQKSWQALVEAERYFYFIYRSLDDFKSAMEWYLKQ